MLALADYANDRGLAFPAVKTLARKSRLSERQTQRVLLALEKAGEIEIQAGAGPHGVNLYRVIKRHARGGDILTGDKMTGVTSEANGGDICDTKGVTPMTPKPSIEPSEEPPENELIAADLFGFVVPGPPPPPAVTAEDIYNAYPRKVGRTEALKAIAKAMKTTPPETILAATQKWAEARANEDPQFTAYPASWFNAGHYLDDPSQWASMKPAGTNGHTTTTTTPRITKTNAI